MYLLSDARARSPAAAGDLVGGIPVTRHIWDLERLWRLDTSGLEHEPVTVDMVANSVIALPCLPGPANEDHRVYVALVPGSLLAQLYGEYGSRLLERNVRAFLQARGAVNKGIRDTLLKDPGRFLAYNNGISATASSAKLSSSGGLQEITELTDLQIVNGGQTTASIYHAQARDKADISQVLVQAKITVVDSSRIDSIVPYISLYANTQNKVPVLTSQPTIRSTSGWKSFREPSGLPHPKAASARHAGSTNALAASTRTSWCAQGQ